MQQALVRFLRCGENTSRRQNRQILFDSKLERTLRRFSPHSVSPGGFFSKQGICNLPGFVYKRRTPADRALRLTSVGE
jgi:hypothetical protein